MSTIVDQFGYAYSKSAGAYNREDTTLDYLAPETIKGWIKKNWEKALIREGFGTPNDKGEAIVEDEINLLLNYDKLSCFYNSSQFDKKKRLAWIVNMIKPYFKAKTLNNSIIPSASLVHDVIQRSAILYNRSPQRSIKVSDDSNTNVQYQSLIAGTDIDNKMLDAYHYAKLFNMVAIRPVFRDVDGVLKLQYDIHTPNTMMIALDASNQPTKILYETSVIFENKRKTAIAVWTRENHYYILDGERFPFGDNTKMINPYNGKLPFVFIKLRGDWYSNGQFDLVDQSIMYDYYMFLTSRDAYRNTYNWNSIVGFDLDTSVQTISPDMILYQRTVDEDSVEPKVEVAQGTPYFDKIKELGNDVYKQSMQTAGVPNIFAGDAVQELSGRALHVAHTHLTDMKIRDALLMRQYEKQLAVLTCEVANLEAGLNIGKIDIEQVRNNFDIDYNENDSSWIDSPENSYKLDMQKVKDGIISIVDVIRKHNPDIISKEQAIQYYKENKDTLDSFEKQGFRALFNSSDNNA